MMSSRWLRFGLTLLLMAQLVVALVFPVNAAAFAETPQESPNNLLSQIEKNIFSKTSPDLLSIAARGPASPDSPQATTLSVEILSTPRGTLDSNNPTNLNSPHVFVVQAKVTNTGAETANDVVVTLDYNPDPANNWVLLAGENPVRTIDSLAPGESYHFYWFARYSSVIGAGHLYTVSASADNAGLVSTSTNAFGDPEPGSTVKTFSTLSTGNSGLTQVSANIMVGVAFTITVGYDLGSNPQNLAFSPAGNIDFNPGSYRLLSSSVRFYNDAGNWQSIAPNQLYFPGPMDYRAENAQVIFTFIALKATNTRLCTYASVGYNSNNKYDQFYCDPYRNTTIPIEGILSLNMLKQASSATILQGQTLNYTIGYNNTGALPLSYTWIWDDVNTAIGSVNLPLVSPAYDPDETTPTRVSWYIGSVAPAGQPGSSGTLSFPFLINGNGQDIPDGTVLNNLASFGINPGSLAASAALTSTTATTVQAPVISIQNSDGQTTAEPGQSLVYTIQLSNAGSVPATGLVVTNVLPAGVTATGSPNPLPDTTTGQQMVWNSLGSLAATNGTQSISIPVTVNAKTSNGTSLQNTATIQYQNTAGYTYATKTATDQTTVNGPLLSITKSGSPNPVLTGKNIVYTLTYTNNGPAGATQAVITDQVPANTTYVSCSGGTSCSESGGTVTWNVGAVASGASASVSFTVTVAATLNTGDVILNDTYGIISGQTQFTTGPAVSTNVNHEAATFNGVAFIDANGNGIFDTGEGTLTGVAIHLPGAVTPNVTSGANGEFTFRVETEGPVAITADDWPTYFHTTSPTIQLMAILGTTKTINFGFASTSSTFGVVFGVVYEDKSADGLQAPGELGIAGVQVASSAAATSPATTDSYGLYTLRFDSPAPSANIVETNPTGYISTTPDTVNKAIATGSSNNSPVDFGDFHGIQITGQVFHDLNVNGAKDGGELGLPGAVVAANGKEYTTAAGGTYSLFVTLTGDGPLQISETDPTGYISTNAIPGTGMTRVDITTLEITAPLSGTVYTNGDFGDALTTEVVTVQGQVWDDNGAGGGGLANGIQDGSEPGLAGAVVSLNTGLSHTTDASGNFTLYAPPNQVLTLVEQNPAGYASTNAFAGSNAVKLNNDKIQVSALSGGSASTGNRFGDVQSANVAVISGFVFDDQNENGLQDGGETGLSGVKVTLEIHLGTSIEVTTGAGGAYQFAVAPGLNLAIKSSGPGGGYYPTTPTSVAAHPATGGNYPNNNFGYSNDTDAAVITGWIFDDRNSNGEPDPGELGLAGTQVSLDNLYTITTSGNGLITGTFTFQVAPASTAPVIHNLKTINLPGYHSTTPDEINVPVVPSVYSYYVEFGDTNATIASIYGIAFNDLNNNGIQNSNEAGLPGVVISVTVGGGTNVVTATTKTYGQFSYGLDIYESGYHTVSEQDPAKAGYHSTTPDSVNLDVRLGNAYSVNFGDSNSGFVTMGTVFDDKNGDGAQDAAEVGLPNVPIALSSGAATTTNLNGGYTIPLTDPAFTPYIVRVIETDPVNYHSTTPNEVPVQVVAAKPLYVVNFGDSNNPYVTSIFGTVFHDVNVNAAHENEELGLAGVPVKLKNDHLFDYVTNEWGQFTFQVDALGPYTVTETNLAGWVSTAAIPGSGATKLSNDILRIQVNSLGISMNSHYFGDAQATAVVTIDGNVWHDNGAGTDGIWADGLRNGTEPGLGGALVSLSSGMVQTTAANGAFVLYGPPAQALILSETNPGGYISTGAVPGSSATKVNRDTLTIAALNGGSTSTGNLFGDVDLNSVTVIKGTVFNDQNGSGAQDPGETGISGVTVKLDGTATRVTDSTGYYEFILPIAGNHTVTETDPSGYFSTMPNKVHVYTVLGKYYTVDFGDASNTANFASIYGTVFEDINNNSLWDDIEPGIQGVTITLDNDVKVLTDLYGRYTFATHTAAQHEVAETDLEDYVSTTPNLQSLAVALGNGYQVDFGDRMTCYCTNDSYEDDNAANQATAILFGSGNAHVCNFCNDATDWRSFTAQARGTYTITTWAKGLRTDTYLELFDSDGKTLLAANDDYAGTTDLSSRIVWEAQKAGTYYIKVSNRALLTRCHTDYELRIDEVANPLRSIYLPVIQKSAAALTSRSMFEHAKSDGTNASQAPLGVITHSCPDIYEVDDTWSQAQPIFNNVPQIHSFDSKPALYAADKDLVSFTMFAGDTVTFTTQVTNTQTRLELFDQNGAALDVTGTNQLSWKAPSHGSYYISISPMNDAFGCANTAGYTLLMKTSALTRILLPIVVR